MITNNAQFLAYVACLGGALTVFSKRRIATHLGFLSFVAGASSLATDDYYGHSIDGYHSIRVNAQPSPVKPILAACKPVRLGGRWDTVYPCKLEKVASLPTPLPQGYVVKTCQPQVFGKTFLENLVVRKCG